MIQEQPGEYAPPHANEYNSRKRTFDIVEGPPTYNTNNDQYQVQAYPPRQQSSVSDGLSREDQIHKVLQQSSYHSISQPHNNPQSSNNTQSGKMNIYVVENARMLDLYVYLTEVAHC